MVPAHAEADYGSWAVEGHPITVEYGWSVLEEICAAAVHGLYQFRHGGVEVGGIFFGTVDGGLVRIDAYRPLPCEHAFGPRFVLSDDDRAALRELLSEPQRDPGLRGLEPVGWYHSHTRSGIALSPRDLEIYGRYFPEHCQVALVIRPEFDGTARAGFFFRELDNSVRAERSYLEFATGPRRVAGRVPAKPGASSEIAEAEPERAVAADAAFEAEAPASPELPAVSEEPAVSGAEAALAETPPAPVEAAPAEVTLPSFVQVQPRRSRKWLWSALAVCCLAAAGIGVERYYRLTAPGPPLSLWVADVGGQLLIEWDRTARPVRNAQSGVLEIIDGGERTEIQMDGDRLREGSVDYVRRAATVDVRLRVDRSGSSPVQEFIRFVGQPVRRLDKEQAEAARQLEELKAEVQKLRFELERRDALIRRLRTGAASPPAPKGRSVPPAGR